MRVYTDASFTQNGFSTAPILISFAQLPYQFCARRGSKTLPQCTSLKCQSTSYECGGQEFESLRARHLVLVCEHQPWPFWLARTAFSSKSLFPLTRT